jgi:hypothetical protein
MARSYSADCRVIFYPFKEEITINITREVALSSFRVDASVDVLDASTSKPKGGVGSFQITLGSQHNYKSILQPGCWCMIFMSESTIHGPVNCAPDGGLKMVGIVRSIRRIENTDVSGIRMVRYTVSGTDFHSGLTNPIYVNSNLTMVANGSGSSLTSAMLALTNVLRKSQKPAEMVQNLIDVLIGTPKYSVNEGTKGVSIGNPGRQGQPFGIPPTMSIDLLGKRAEGDYFTAILTSFLQTNLVGSTYLQSDIGNMASAWSLIQSYSHPILNEVYTDLLPVDTGYGVRLTPSIVLRAIPFSSDRKIDPSVILLSDAGANSTPIRKKNRAFYDKKNKEPGDKTPPGTGSHFYISRRIYEEDILSFNSGRSDRERFNFFFCPSNYATFTTEASLLNHLIKTNGYKSFMDEQSIARNGLRPFVESSNYMIGSTDSTEKINVIVRDLWVNAHLFENGVLQVVGTKEAIPVGTNIALDDRGWLAHVEQVDNNFTVSNSGGAVYRTFRTTLAFSRLHYIDESSKKAMPVAFDDQLGAQIDSDWDRGASFTEFPGNYGGRETDDPGVFSNDRTTLRELPGLK